MPHYDEQLFSPPAPVAAVSLRNPGDHTVVSDVPMLLDSGADVTLIPETFVSRIGADIRSHKTYELSGFDGHTAFAHAVHLDLIFLKRAFRGRFLVIDQEWGILGRDILNHIALLLDGPG